MAKGKFWDKGNITPILILSSVLILAIVFFFTPGLKTSLRVPEISPTPTEMGSLKSYSSQDLKIIFNYPKGWFVNEKDFDIMITSYETRIGENKAPTSNEIKIFVGFFSNCFPDYERDLIYPGCGEGGEESKNTIVSKESREVQAGTFYKYVIRTHSGEDLIYYLLYKDDKNILKIDKSPDPSQFEKEFEEIVNSIKFLD